MYKLTVRFNDADKGIYFKQYLCRSVWDFIKHFVRANRAERAFKASEMLGKNGFDTPATIAMGKTANFMVTLEIENAKQILQFISDNNLETRDRRELIREFGRTIGQMHTRGIFHGDLRLGNILARHEKNHWKFFFIDNERTKKFRHLPARLWVKNLVQVNTLPPVLISNTDRMRFFREYCAQNEKAETEKTALIKKVLEKTRLRLDKKRNLRIASEIAGHSRTAV
ncbi:MAG: lipopolysaccharide kinase InaA family protein [Phycisphaerae bacterium]|nr:lipopolysaccharide kinase InaA family protein [Phycisphaerae bacterium]MDD5381215.1 lipopolysaccharide kinase InaA family protein [Phycisphaerae bacterium]